MIIYQINKVKLVFLKVFTDWKLVLYSIIIKAL